MFVNNDVSYKENVLFSLPQIYFFFLNRLIRGRQKEKIQTQTVSDWTGTRLVIGYRMKQNRLQRLVKRREFAHNPSGTKVSSNTSKYLDAKLEIKTGKFGNVGATGKKKFFSELKERKRKGNGSFDI